MEAAVKSAIRDPLDEVARRGEEHYRHLHSTLEREHSGEIVAIHPDSGDHAVAGGEEEALRVIRSRHPEGLLFVRRIGPGTAADRRLAARIEKAQRR